MTMRRDPKTGFDKKSETVMSDCALYSFLTRIGGKTTIPRGVNISLVIIKNI